MRHFPWVILSFVVAGILTTLVMSSALHSGFARFGIANTMLLGLVSLSQLISVVSGIVTFVVMLRIKKVMIFTDEVIGELFKVSWPVREETLKASITVVVTAVFTASLLSAYDYIWKNVADYFLFTAG